MRPELFYEEDELTVFSENLHAILGRALIVATRFDSSCRTLAVALRLRFEASNLGNEGVVSPEEFDELIDDAVMRIRKHSLASALGKLAVGEAAKETLNSSRLARNEIAHDLAKGMDCCVDIYIDEAEFLHRIEDAVNAVAKGEWIVHRLISLFNREDFPARLNSERFSEAAVKWVVGHRCT